MSEDFLTEFLACILQEQGIQNPHLVAARAAADLRRARIVHEEPVSRAKRRIKVYSLRCQGLTVEAIAERMGVHIATVKRMVSEEITIRRSA